MDQFLWVLNTHQLN